MIKRCVKISCIAILSFLLCGCTRIETIFSIQNYDAYIQNLITNYDYDIYELPEIDEYEPLIRTQFTFATHFSEKLAYVVYENDHLLMTGSGKLIRCENFLGYEIREEKYIYEENGKYGLKDIFGNVILQAKYKKIQYLKDMVLAVDDERASGYFKGNNVFYINNSKYKEIELLSENDILLDGKIKNRYCVTHNTAPNIVLLPENEGRRLIADANFKLGFADTNDKVVIMPQFDKASNFKDGYSVAEKDGLNLIIDLKGKTVLSSRDKMLFIPFGDTVCFRSGNLYGIMDCNYRVILEPIMHNIKYNKAFGNIIVTNDGAYDRFFDINQLNYKLEPFETIEFLSNGHFICKRQNGEFILLNDSLEILLDNCTGISYKNGILKVESQQSFKFYRDRSFFC